MFIQYLFKQPQGGWFIKEEEKSLHLKTQEGLPSHVDAWAHARAPPEHETNNHLLKFKLEVYGRRGLKQLHK